MRVEPRVSARPFRMHQQTKGAGFLLWFSKVKSKEVDLKGLFSKKAATNRFRMEDFYENYVKRWFCERI